MEPLPSFIENPIFWIASTIFFMVVVLICVLMAAVAFGVPILIFWRLLKNFGGGKKTIGGSDVSVGDHGRDSGGFFGGDGGGDGGGNGGGD